MVSVTALVAAAVVVALLTGRSTVAARPPFQAIPPTRPRPQSSMVTSDAVSLRVAWTGARAPIFVDDRAEVSTLRALLDRLPAEGPGTCAEGALVGPPRVSFVFLSSSGVRVATATGVDRTEHPVAWCEPLALSDGGDRVALEGMGYFLRAAERTLGRRLGASSPPGRDRR